MTPPANRASRRPPVELVGLFLIFAASAGLSLWQASNHLTPTIFTDELEMTTLSRSIAETGHGFLQGVEVGWSSVPLSAYLSAPFWWINDVPSSHRGGLATAATPWATTNNGIHISGGPMENGLANRPVGVRSYW